MFDAKFCVKDDEPYYELTPAAKKKKILLNARFVGHLILPLLRQMSGTRKIIKMINKKEMTIMLYISSCSHWIGR